MKRSSNGDESRSSRPCGALRDETSELLRRCRELEGTVALWAAANEAKAARITELEALCSQLQQRVARLGRREGKRERPAKLAQVRHAR